MFGLGYHRVLVEFILPGVSKEDCLDRTEYMIKNEGGVIRSLSMDNVDVCIPKHKQSDGGDLIG